jgi:hypothetical protein
MPIHGLWFGDGWAGEWFGDDAVTPLQNGYFGHRYFATPFYGPRYFAPYDEVVLSPPATGQNGYFGHRYFSLGHYGHRYFAPYGSIVLIPSTPEDETIVISGSFGQPFPHIDIDSIRRQRILREDEIAATIIAAWLNTIGTS